MTQAARACLQALFPDCLTGGARIKHYARRCLAAAACCLVAACGGEPPRGYFPLDEGLAWDYRVTTTTPYKRSENTLQIENLGERRVGGELYHVRKSGTGNHYYLQQLDEGIVRAAKRTVIEKRPRPAESGRFVLKEPLQPGTRWTYRVKPYLLARPFPVETPLKRAFDYDMQWQILADGETVEVPAGRFEQCLHIRGEARLEIARSLSVARDEIVFRTDEWYAPGVGLVKLEHREIIDSDQAYGGIITLHLTAFNY